jgi:hypothetical protein
VEQTTRSLAQTRLADVPALTERLLLAVGCSALAAMAGRSPTSSLKSMANTAA